MISGENIIGFVKSKQSTQTFKTFNPRLNEQNPWLFYEATDDEINEACSLAQKAFKLYRKKSFADRTLFIKEICSNLQRDKPTLIEVYCKETGFTKSRAAIELERTIFQLNNYNDRYQITVTAHESKSVADDRDFSKSLIPLGPVVVFGASNFPFAYSTAGGDTASALAAGCPVIIKSHPWHAGTSELVAKAIIEAAKTTGMPDGVFSNLNSSGIEVGKALALNSAVKAIGFTGSVKGGRAIMDLAASREEPIPVYAEMGSTNPIFLTKGVLKENSLGWAKKIADSMIQGNGQYCTSPGLIIAQKSSEFDLFKKQMAANLDLVTPEFMLHPQIAENYTAGISTVISDMNLTKTGGITDRKAVPALINLSAQDFISNREYHDEIFGPFAIFIEYESKQECDDLIESLNGQLTGTILHQENENVDGLIEKLQYKVGRLILNSVPTGVSVVKAMHHGGPYPSSSDSRFTAVGEDAVLRWLRPITIQRPVNS